jgi:hypothetical protein
MKFRPQRGGIDEAMKGVVEVDGLAGLIEHLRAIHPPFGPPFDPDKVIVRPYDCDDERIGWKDVHIVFIEGWGPVGFCEGAPEPQNKPESVLMAALGPCLHCGFDGRPWYEVEQKYDLAFEGDHQLWAYIECPQCHERTTAHPDEEDAEKDWNSGKLALPPAP